MNCAACPAGQFNDDMVSQACRNCTNGTFAAYPGMPSCTACTTCSDLASTGDSSSSWDTSSATEVYSVTCSATTDAVCACADGHCPGQLRTSTFTERVAAARAAAASRRAGTDGFSAKLQGVFGDPERLANLTAAVAARREAVANASTDAAAILAGAANATSILVEAERLVADNLLANHVVTAGAVRSPFADSCAPGMMRCHLSALV